MFKKIINILIIVTLLSQFIFCGSVFASEIPDAKLSKIEIETKYKQDVEMIKNLHDSAKKEKQSIQKLEAEHQRLVKEFERYIDEKLSKDGVDPIKFRQIYKEKYVKEFVEFAIRTGLISNISIEPEVEINSSFTKDFLRSQWYIASLLMDEVGLKYTSLFLQHSLCDNPSMLQYDEGTELSDIIKNSQAFQVVLDNFKQKLDTCDDNYYVESDSFALNSDNSSEDMYLALHNVNYLLTAELDESEEWQINALISDLYNYEYWNYGGSGSVPHEVVTIINNYAAASLELGAIVQYEIRVFISDTYCAMEAAAANQSTGLTLLSTLRDFRDTTLAANENGKQLINLYYRSSPYLLKEVIKDAQFKKDIYDDVVGLQGLIQSCIASSKGKQVNYMVSNKDIDKIKKLMNRALPVLPQNLQDEILSFWNSMQFDSYIGMTLQDALLKVKQSPKSEVNSRKIVVFERGLVDGNKKDEILQHAGVAKIKDLALINASVVDIAPSEEKLLSKQVGVLRVDPDVEVFTQEMPQSTVKAVYSETIPWGVNRIGANQIWDKNNDYIIDQGANAGDGVKVAVLDTGIDLNHPDLKDNIIDGFNTINYNKKANDDNGHGTHVAGIIAAVNNSMGIIGVAPKVRLYPVKILNKNGSGYTSDIIEGLQWCIDNNMQIVNMSFGTSTDVPLLYEAVIAAKKAGIVLVAAAGNSGPGDNSVCYPAKYPEVIAVSATDNNDNFASWSSRGTEVMLAAPGINIYSTYKGGGYETLSGTSMAAPHVTASATLVIDSGITDSNNDGMINDEVYARLRNTSEDLGIPGHDDMYGYGLVIVKKAIDIQTAP